MARLFSFSSLKITLLFAQLCMVAGGKVTVLRYAIHILCLWAHFTVTNSNTNNVLTIWGSSSN
jgi:hypothetical protein